MDEYREMGVFEARVLVDKEYAIGLLLEWDLMLAKFLDHVWTVDVVINGKKVREASR